MNALTMTFPRPQVNVGQMLKVVGLPTEGERVLPIGAQAPDIIRELVKLVDGLVAACIDKRTATDFNSARTEVFPQYVAAIIALGTVSRIVLSNQTIELLSMQSFSVMEADLRDGGSVVGADLAERGLFTIWTIRKIYDLAKEIESFEAPKDHAEEDAAQAQEFVNCALWNRFHVDCLLKAIGTQKPIYPDVVEPVRDGLRAAVNAYATIRQWAEIRNPIPEIELPEIPFSTEDADWIADTELETA